MISAFVALGGLSLIAIYLCLTVDKSEQDKHLLDLHNLQLKQKMSNYLKDSNHLKSKGQDKIAISNNFQLASGKYEHLAINKGKRQKLLDEKNTHELEKQ